MNNKLKSILIIIVTMMTIYSCKKETTDIAPLPDPIPSLTEFNKGFIFEINTRNQGSVNTKFVLPLDEISSYDFYVNWGDGKVEKISGTSIKNVTHDYDSDSTYTIKVIGTFPYIKFMDVSSPNLSSIDRLKITDIKQWGNIKWSDMTGSFLGCSNLDVTANDTPNLSGIVSTQSMFKGCSSLVGTPIFNNWNLSNIRLISSMFNGCTSFNQDIGNWDVSNVTEMSNLFTDAKLFNQDIGNWNTVKVTNMFATFRGASSFNKNIGNWKTNNVTSMVEMFRNATSFNQNVSSWNTGKVTQMSSMFRDASSFNQDLGSWTLVSLNSSTPNSNLVSMFDNSGMTTENYSKTLIGWANSISSNGGLPSGQTLGAYNMSYNDVNYVTGTYSNAIDARNYLTTSIGWTIVGDKKK